MNTAKNNVQPSTRWWLKMFLPVLAVGGVVLMILPACKREQEPVMRIGVDVSPGCEPLFLARHQGTLGEESFRLVEFSNGSAVARAFRNRSIESACLTMDEVFYLLQDDMDPVILLVLDQSNGADVLLAHPEIKRLQDLKGKRIGVEFNAVETYTLTRALQHAGLTIHDVSPVYIPIEKHLEAYKAGSVDAVVTFEPTRTKLLALGAVDLFNSSMIPGEIMDVVIVRRDYLELHRAQADALKQAWFKALQQLRQSPGDSMTIMAVREQVTAEEFKNSLRGLYFPNETENSNMLESGHPALSGPAQRLKAIMLSARLLRRDVSLKSLFSVTNPTTSALQSQ